MLNPRPVLQLRKLLQATKFHIPCIYYRQYSTVYNKHQTAESSTYCTATKVQQLPHHITIATRLYISIVTDVSSPQLHMFHLPVMFGFRRNPDVAGNGRLGGQKRVRPIAIDYCTVAGTAGVGCKRDRRSKGPDSQSPFQTPTAFQRHKGEETQR